MGNTLLLFLKAPVPGKVKTRLAKDIGEKEAALAYIDMARAIRDEAELLHNTHLQWVYAPTVEYPDLGWLDIPDAAFWNQSDGDLGKRLSTAFQRAFSEYGGPVCAMGMDSPGLPSKRIRESFLRLENKDFVLGPTEDGGYYLIGMSKFHAELFENIPWSSEQTAKATLEHSQKLNLETDLLATYFDIDTLSEYERWKQGPSSAIG